MVCGWLKIADAPLDTLGHVWSPQQTWGNRTDILGTVIGYTGKDGNPARMVSSTAHGFELTRWHPLPEPPDA